MANTSQELQQTLQTNGLSLTKPRLVVFAALQAHDPQTMHELVAHCAAIDRATVYRTIELFERLHIVQRLQLGWKYKLELTGQFMHHHHHLSCEQCGQVTALPEDPAMEQRLLALAKSQGFVAHDHQVEIRGLCAQCHSKLDNEPLY